MHLSSENAVCWVQITEEDLSGIVPGSALAHKILKLALLQESNWRKSYINAVERIIINPEMLVFEDAPISEPTNGPDDEDGAYVMCWQFIPHAAVIPPKPDTKDETRSSLHRLKRVASLLE